ncbi:MAG: hypothetical protein AAGF12_26130 [Myxococcota bacterium]
MRLEDAFRKLGPEGLTDYLNRNGIAPRDSGGATQDEFAWSARRAVHLPILETQTRWSPSLRRGIDALVGVRPGLPREALGEEAAAAVLRSGLAFEFDGALRIPGAFRAQIRPSPLEHPNGVRSLLVQLEPEAIHPIVRAWIGRRPLPREFAIEALLECFEDPRAIRKAIRELDPEIRRLLRALDRRGGDLLAEEVLHIAGSAARYRTAAGELLPKKGPVHELVRRGLLLPRQHRWIVPEEVASVVGARSRSQAASLRKSLKEKVRTQDLAPARADLSSDPGPRCLALLAGLVRADVDLDARAGVPKQKLRSVGRSVGEPENAAELLVALGRRLGLHARPLPQPDVGHRLFARWRSSQSYDEARRVADGYRIAPALYRTPSPTLQVRNLVLSLLHLFPSDRFAPLQDLRVAVLAQPEARSLRPLLERTQRTHPGAFIETLEELIDRISTESLPTLGGADVGETEDGVMLRLSRRARRWLDEEAEPESKGQIDDPPTELDNAPAAEWTAPGRLRLQHATSVQAIRLGSVADTFPSGAGLDLRFSSETIREHAEKGLSFDAIRADLVDLGMYGDAIDALIRAAPQPPICHLLEAAGFVWVPNQEIRAALLASDKAGKIFSRQSPTEGLIVLPQVAPRVVQRLLREVGAIVGSGAPSPGPDTPDTPE